MNKNLEELSDNEIILLIRKNDDNAMEYMLKKYSGVVKKEIRTVYLTGAEMDDLAQEGMIGLFKAIRDYEPDKGASFHTFATLCIEAGVDPKVLSEILGHASVQITLDRYVHPSLEIKRTSLGRLFSA